MHYYGFNGIKYDVGLLWKITANNPPVRVDISHFEKVIKQCPWRSKDGSRVGPGTLLEAGSDKISGCTEHYERVENANMNYPIIVELDHHIVDGYHRITGALLSGKTEVEVKFVTPEQIHRAMFESSGSSPRSLYSVSNTSMKDWVQPIPSRKSPTGIVFGTPYMWMAIVMGGIDSVGNRWTDKDLEVGIETQQRNEFGSIPILRELKPGAFKQFFEQPIHIHVVSSNKFNLHDGHPEYCYYSTPEPAKIISTETFNHPIRTLREVLGSQMIEYSI